MKAIACILLLSAMLATTAPGASPSAFSTGARVVILLDEDQTGRHHRRRRRNHYRGW